MATSDSTSLIEKLPDRSIIAATGPDVEDLLQRVVTANLETLKSGIVRDCALLTPQGKVLFQFMVSRRGDGFALDCPTEHLEPLVKRLTLYKLRANANFEIADQLGVYVSGQEFDRALRDERAPELGFRAYGTDLEASENTYTHRRILAGVPEILDDFESGDAFAHEVLLDETGGIDFKKGCYVGQEVVSRVEHRATARKRFVKVSGDTDLPPKGTPITVEGKSIGLLGSTSGPYGLGLVRIDKLPSPDAATIDGAPVALCVPDFADFSIGGPDG
jgi:hypothetical protein